MRPEYLKEGALLIPLTLSLVLASSGKVENFHLPERIYSYYQINFQQTLAAGTSNASISAFQFYNNSGSALIQWSPQT